MCRLFFSPIIYLFISIVFYSVSFFCFRIVFVINILYPASHAHTLLLDLEQLVVVANLDKINIDSPTCSAIAASSSLSSYMNAAVALSTTTTTTSTRASFSSAMQSLSYGDGYGDGLLYANASSMIDYITTKSSLLTKSSGKNCNDAMLICGTEFGLFDQYLDNSKCTAICRFASHYILVFLSEMLLPFVVLQIYVICLQCWFVSYCCN